MDEVKFANTFNKKSIREKMQYNVGDKVFAKVRGFPPWPARITEPVKVSLKNSCYEVFFYGTKQSAKINAINLFPFIEMTHILGKEKKVKDFNDSMNAILKDLSAKEKLKLSELEIKSKSKDENITPTKSTKSKVNTRKKRKSDIRSKISRYGRKFKPKGELDSLQSPNTPETQEMVDNANSEVEKNALVKEISSDNAPKSNCEDDQEFERAIDPKLEGPILNGLELQKYNKELIKYLNMNDPNPVLADKVLDNIVGLTFNKVTIHLHPDIVTTLMKSRRYHNIKNPDKFPPDIDEIIRDKSNEQFHRIKKIFNVPEGMEFIDYFQRVHNEFSRETAAMTPHELLDLYKNS